jgi:adenylate cyclase
VRYLKATLLFGSIAAVLTAALFAAGVFRGLDQTLYAVLKSAAASPVQRPVVQYLAIALFAFGIAWTTIDIGKVPLKVVVAVAALLEIIAAVWVLNLYHFYFSPFASGVALALSFTGGLFYSHSDAGRRKRVLHSIFGDRISQKAFTDLVNSNKPLNFDGEMREATVFVCEIFNHNELMDTLPVTDYVAMNNLFLRTGANFLVERGAYLDECDGESLRVIFGTPVENPRHAAVACASAIELVTRLENLNRECDGRWHKTFDFRIGLSAGEMVAAAYGSDRLGTYSVAGEAVEFGRRLCSANMIYGSRILIGSRVFELAVDSIEVRPIEMLHIREDRSPEEVYELLALKNVLSEDALQRRDLFWKGIVFFREQRWDEALEHFHASLSQNGFDGPVEFYIRRTEQVRDGMPMLEWSPTSF